MKKRNYERKTRSGAGIVKDAVANYEQVLLSLPELLRKKPEYKYKLYAILEEHFPPRKETNRILAEIHKLREDTNRRFENMTTDMNRRFENMNLRFENLTTEMNRRFQDMNLRLKDLTIEMNRRFQDMNLNFEDMKSWVQLTAGRFQARAGLSLEETIAGVLRLALHTPDVKPENLKIRQKIVDNTGLIGKSGREYEYDIFISDDKYMIFEIKSAPDVEDVVRFADKCELVIDKFGLEKDKVRKVLVTLAKESEVAKVCIENNIFLC